MRSFIKNFGFGPRGNLFTNKQPNIVTITSTTIVSGGLISVFLNFKQKHDKKKIELSLEQDIMNLEKKLKEEQRFYKLQIDLLHDVISWNERVVRDLEDKLNCIENENLTYETTSVFMSASDFTRLRTDLLHDIKEKPDHLKFKEEKDEIIN